MREGFGEHDGVAFELGKLLIGELERGAVHVEATLGGEDLLTR